MKFYIGLFLLFVNLPFGWLAAFYFTKKSEEENNRKYYSYAIFSYLVSWIMLLLGGYLAGSKGKKIFTAYKNNIFNLIPFNLIMLLLSLALIFLLFFLIKNRKFQEKTK